ncbi:MAG TPA: helix-turn-helix transcriptional regulator [Polyangiaceae bacterium]
MTETSNEQPPTLLRVPLIKRRAPTTHTRNRGPGPKEKRLGPAIRKARRETNLTQAQLGKRLGIEAQTVHRWEINKAAPTPRHEREMVKVIATYSADAAAALQAVFDKARSKATPVAAAPPGVAVPALPAAPQPASLGVGATELLQLAVFGLADDLDLPPRHVRRPLARFFESLRAAQLTFDAVELQLNSWIAEQRH